MKTFLSCRLTPDAAHQEANRYKQRDCLIKTFYYNNPLHVVQLQKAITLRHTVVYGCSCTFLNRENFGLENTQLIPLL